MPPEQIALILSIASFVGVIVGPIGTAIINARQTNIEREELRRKEQGEYLSAQLLRLVKLRADLQYLQGASGSEAMQREIAYGEAFALMLASGDNLIEAKADMVMKGDVNKDGNEKLTAINDAIKILGRKIIDLH